jgi:hypothetical protein
MVHGPRSVPDVRVLCRSGMRAFYKLHYIMFETGKSKKPSCLFLRLVIPPSRFRGLSTTNAAIIFVSEGFGKRRRFQNILTRDFTIVFERLRLKPNDLIYTSYSRSG